MNAELIEKSGLKRMDLLEAHMMLSADIERLKDMNSDGCFSDIIERREMTCERFRVACGL